MEIRDDTSVIRRLRGTRTLREVAAGVGVTERTLIRWEQRHCRPAAEHLLRLADYFGVEPRALLVGLDRAA
jgi:transcriptional regulator with XRE-family HTH domain